MRLFSDIAEVGAGPVFHSAPSARGLGERLAAYLPEDALLWAPAGGVLLLLAAYLICEAGLFSGEDVR